MKRLMTLTAAMLSLTVFGAKEAVWEGTATSSWDADASWRNGIKPEAGDWIWVVAGKTLPSLRCEYAAFEDAPVGEGPRHLEGDLHP